jgi:imidazolonepropionase-like amidohydrolase
MNRLFVRITASALVALALTPIISIAATTTVLHCGHLVDVPHERITPNVDLLVDEGRISLLGASVVLPAGAKQVDLRNRYCMPGMMDMHTHTPVG